MFRVRQCINCGCIASRPRSEENKQERNSEVETSSHTRLPSPYSRTEDSKKTTTPTKVKIKSTERRPKASLNSPSLKRLKTQKIAKISPITSPFRQKLRNSPLKPRNFNQILNKWEELSTIDLIQAVAKPPRLPDSVDKMLEKVGTAVWNLIGREIWRVDYFKPPANEKPPQRKFWKL